ncbi:hypothetical protein [Arthrobacter sp. UYCu723]
MSFTGSSGVGRALAAQAAVREFLCKAKWEAKTRRWFWTMLIWI